MLARLRQWRDAFYRGPADLGITLPRRRGYQSPTLTLMLWAHAVTHRHVTYGGRVLLMLSSFLVPFGMISLLMPVHLFAFALVGLFGVNLLVGLALRPRLRVTRLLPGGIPAGQAVRVEYALENRGRLPCFDVALDTLPWPRPFRFPAGHACVRCLAPGARLRLHAWIRAARRGAYTVPAVRADSAFPFHLWRWGCTAAQGPVPLRVHPPFTPLRTLPLPGGGRWQSGETGRTALGGHSHEFVGCREFRSGDSIRRLHWLSWARVGYPVVKEFRDYFQLDVTLLLDTHRHRPWAALRQRLRWEPPDPLFEAGVALAAAVADFLFRERAVVRLLTPGASAGTGGAGPQAPAPPLTAHERTALLDRLAGVNPEPLDRFPAEARDSLRRGPAPGCVWFVLLAWDEPRRALLEWLAARGIPWRGVVVCRATGAGAPPESGLLNLRADDILAGRCRDLGPTPGAPRQTAGGGAP